MENLRDSSLKNRLGSQRPVPEESACSDADEDNGTGRRWSIILIFAVVPLVLLVTVLFGGFALVSTAFGAEQTEQLAANSDVYGYRF